MTIITLLLPYLPVSFTANLFSMKKSALFLLALSALPALLNAHPGHGYENGWTILHYLVNPEHALPFAAVLVLGIIVYARFREVREAKKNR